MVMEKRIIQEDFELTLSFIEGLPFEDIVKKPINMDCLKTTHKAVYVFFIWQLALSNKSIANYWMQEICSTLIQLLFVVALADVKIAYMLYRNIIDNFLKHLLSSSNMPIEQNTDDNFHSLLTSEKLNESDLFRRSINRIQIIYKECCGYVHSTQLQYYSLYESMVDYIDSAKEAKNLDKCTDAFNKLMTSIIELLILTNKDIYEGLDHEDKTLINLYCNRADLKDIYYEFYYK